MPFATESKRATKVFVRATNKFVKECEKNYAALSKSLKSKELFDNPSDKFKGELLDFDTITQRVLKDSAPAPSTPRSATPGTK